MFEIRNAEPADMGVLRDVFRRSALFNEQDRMSLLQNPDCLELSEVAVAEGRTRAAVLGDGPIIGFASFVLAGHALEVEDLFVAPECMRQGVGRALMLDLESIARQRGLWRIEVTANQDAIVFYQNAGFVVDGQVETRFRPAPRMHLDLDLIRDP